MEGGGGVVGGLAGLLQDHSIGGFEGGWVVSESHQGGEEFKEDCGVDEVNLFPYGEGNAIRTRGRGGEGLGEGEFNCSFSEGGGRGVSPQVTPVGQGVLRGKEVVQERFIDCNWVRGIGQKGKPGGLSQGDQLFGRPDVVWRGFCKEISPVGSFSSSDTFEVAELRLSCCVVGVWGLGLFGSPGGFREFLSQSG